MYIDHSISLVSSSLRLGFTVLAFLISFPIAIGQCPNELFTVVDTATRPLSIEAGIRLDQLKSNPYVNYVKVIEMNDFGETLGHDTLHASMDLEIGEICILVLNYGLISRNDSTFYWAGANSDGDVFELNRDELGYTGYYKSLGLDSEDPIYVSFTPLSSTETALIEYDPEGMFDFDCISPDTVQDTTGEDVLSSNLEVRLDCDHPLTRVLFLYTEMSLLSGRIPEVVGSQVINQMNSALSQSGVPPEELTFEVAGVALLPDFVESGLAVNDVKALANNEDAMDLREEFFADIVVLLTAPVSSDAAGRARYYSTNSENPYAVIWITLAAEQLGAIHEIGHVIGSRHQREEICNASPDNHTKHHGYTIGDNMATVMHIPACSKNRVAIWSSDDTEFMGLSTGNEDNQTTRKFHLRSDVIPCFRGEPVTPGPIPVNIDGPQGVTTCWISNYVWTAEPTSGLTSPISYLWEWSPNGVNSWSTIGTNNFISINPQSLPSHGFFLRLVITDGEPSTGYYSMRVTVFDCDPIFTETVFLNGTKIVIYPVPSDDLIYIQGENLERIKDWYFVDLNGRIKYANLISRTEQKIVQSIKNFTHGSYYLVIRDRDGIENKYKVIKL